MSVCPHLPVASLPGTQTHWIVQHRKMGESQVCGVPMVSSKGYPFLKIIQTCGKMVATRLMSGSFLFVFFTINILLYRCIIPKCQEVFIRSFLLAWKSKFVYFVEWPNENLENCPAGEGPKLASSIQLAFYAGLTSRTVTIWRPCPVPKFLAWKPLTPKHDWGKKTNLIQPYLPTFGTHSLGFAFHCMG